jgi:hypothetical protein
MLKNCKKMHSEIYVCSAGIHISTVLEHLVRLAGTKQVGSIGKASHLYSGG